MEMVVPWQLCRTICPLLKHSQNRSVAAWQTTCSAIARRALVGISGVEGEMSRICLSVVYRPIGTKLGREGPVSMETNPLPSQPKIIFMTRSGLFLDITLPMMSWMTSH